MTVSIWRFNTRLCFFIRKEWTKSTANKYHSINAYRLCWQRHTAVYAAHTTYSSPNRSKKPTRATQKENTFRYIQTKQRSVRYSGPEELIALKSGALLFLREYKGYGELSTHACCPAVVSTGRYLQVPPRSVRPPGGAEPQVDGVGGVPEGQGPQHGAPLLRRLQAGQVTPPPHTGQLRLRPRHPRLRHHVLVTPATPVSARSTHANPESLGDDRPAFYCA